MRAMVFAAGLGTRLRPLTDERAKPAVPVAGLPMVSYSLLHLAAFGVRDVVLNAHHLPETVEHAVAPLRDRFTSLVVLREPVLLGTGGGLRAALPHLDDGDDVLVMNGDILFTPDLGAALALHRARRAKATMVVRESPDAAKLGAVELDGEGAVRRLLGLPGGVTSPLRATMFTGVHVLSPDALRGLPEEGCIIRKAYRHWVDRGETVCGHVETVPFRDVGTLASYLETNLDLVAGRLRSPYVAPPPGASYVDPRATVDPGVTLERCVVWDGAHVTQGAHDAVITPRGVVRL